MKSDSIAFGIAGIFFGLIAGWIIGSQQAALRPAPAPAPAATAASNAAPTTRAAVVDEAQVTALKSVAEREPASAAPRTQLGNLYFDAERYDDAIKWYEEAAEAGAEGRQHQHRPRRLLLLHEPAGQGARAIRPLA